MGFLTPKAPAAPPPPPPPPNPAILAGSGAQSAGAAQRAAAAASFGAGDTVKTSAEGAPAPTTTSGGKGLLGE